MNFFEACLAIVWLLFGSIVLVVVLGVVIPYIILVLFVSNDCIPQPPGLTIHGERRPGNRAWIDLDLD